MVKADITSWNCSFNNQLLFLGIIINFLNVLIYQESEYLCHAKPLNWSDGDFTKNLNDRGRGYIQSWCPHSRYMLLSGILLLPPTDIICFTATTQQHESDVDTLISCTHGCLAELALYGFCIPLVLPLPTMLPVSLPHLQPGTHTWWPRHWLWHYTMRTGASPSTASAFTLVVVASSSFNIT